MLRIKILHDVVRTQALALRSFAGPVPMQREQGTVVRSSHVVMDPCWKRFKSHCKLDHVGKIEINVCAFFVYFHRQGQRIGYLTSFSSKIVSGWTIRTLLWKNTSGSRKKKLETCKVYTGNPLFFKYGKIRYDEDVHNLRSVETEFLAIVFNDEVSFEKTLSCEYSTLLNDFENEFPAIVYNDAQMSKSDLLTESFLSPQHIDEFDLNDETSVSEYDEEEENILYFNGLSPSTLFIPMI
ncbi:hypothetical protein Tco_0517083 [Tanacetum coccineum]